jgi:protein SCO1/2
MKVANWRLVVVLVITGALAGCGGGSSKSTADKTYSIRGKVTAVNPEKPFVKLDHEDIPGLMKAMEMEFRVEDAKLLSGIAVGDQVQGRLKSSGEGYVITQLEKL